MRQSRSSEIELKGSFNRYAKRVDPLLMYVGCISLTGRLSELKWESQLPNSVALEKSSWFNSGTAK